MRSSTTPDFWLAYVRQPPEVKSRARRVYQLWKENPHHPSLRFEKKGDYWSIRIGPGYRALGRYHEGTLYWFWIGTHDEYERLLSSL